MADEARRCIAALDERKQDFTMLWLLREPDWLGGFKMGEALRDWARNIVGIPLAVCSSEGFQDEVSREFGRRGVRPVAPERCVDSSKKDTAKQMCLDAKWPKPFFPVMLQTRPGPTQKGYGAFIMFSGWQDAMIALRRIAETKRYVGRGGESYAAEMVFENQVTDMSGYDFPCRIILDCDAKLKEFGSGLSIEDLCQSIDKVPEFFTRRLIEIGAIRATDKVTVYEKEKSRPGKASRHYIFSIMGCSTWDTRTVLHEIFGVELEKMQDALDKAVNAGKEKGKRKLPPGIGPPEPWRVTDTVPHHGRGQYSVLGFFNREKGETELPCITHRWVIVGGKTISRKSCSVSREESTLRHPMALQMLHKTCYSCFVGEFITIHPKFMMQKQQVLLFFLGFFFTSVVGYGPL